jgi:hypothetical protein
LPKVAQRLLFYAGLGLVTAATLMLQIVETRIISVTSWYHLAFFVISIAMLGLTAGAVWVYLRAETFRPAQLSYHLNVASLGFALATVFALLVQLTIVTSLPASVMSLVVRPRPGRLPHGFWLSNRNAVGFHDRQETDPLVLGYQRRSGGPCGECRRADESRVRH